MGFSPDFVENRNVATQYTNAFPDVAVLVHFEGLINSCYFSKITD